MLSGIEVMRSKSVIITCGDKNRIGIKVIIRERQSSAALRIVSRSMIGSALPKLVGFHLNQVCSFSTLLVSIVFRIRHFAFRYPLCYILGFGPSYCYDKAHTLKQRPLD